MFVSTFFLVEIPSVCCKTKIEIATINKVVNYNFQQNEFIFLDKHSSTYL